jgi:hypothetical protein
MAMPSQEKLTFEQMIELFKDNSLEPVTDSIPESTQPVSPTNNQPVLSLSDEHRAAIADSTSYVWRD